MDTGQVNPVSVQQIVIRYQTWTVPRASQHNTVCPSLPPHEPWNVHLFVLQGTCICSGIQHEIKREIRITKAIISVSQLEITVNLARCQPIGPLRFEKSSF